MDNSDCYYYEHSWKSKLRQLGRHVRKLLATCGPMKLRRRRAGYVRFETEEEQRLRRMARDEIDLSAKLALAYAP